MDVVMGLLVCRGKATCSHFIGKTVEFGGRYFSFEALLINEIELVARKNTIWKLLLGKRVEIILINLLLNIFFSPNNRTIL